MYIQSKIENEVLNNPKNIEDILNKSVDSTDINIGETVYMYNADSNLQEVLDYIYNQGLHDGEAIKYMAENLKSKYRLVGVRTRKPFE
jgi:hypothetical protein